MERRQLEQLINNEEPGWQFVQDWAQEASNSLEILPASDPQRAEALLDTQVTTRSIMGAIIYESGGILVDHGWLRILGSGHEKMRRSLPAWNQSVGIDFAVGAPFILIADDVVGGFFALDGGGLGNPGKVFYFAPDSLEWEDLEKSYSEFIHWCFSADLELFYSKCRWPNWQAEIGELNGNQGIFIYPFLWAAGPPVEERSRKPAPISEMYHIHFETLKQLDSAT